MALLKSIRVWGCCEVTSFRLVWASRKQACDVQRVTQYKYPHSQKIQSHSDTQTRSSALSATASACVSIHVFVSLVNVYNFSQIRKPLYSEPEANKRNEPQWFRPTCLSCDLQLCHFLTTQIKTSPLFVIGPPLCKDTHRSLTCTWIMSLRRKGVSHHHMLHHWGLVQQWKNNNQSKLYSSVSQLQPLWSTQSCPGSLSEPIHKAFRSLTHTYFPMV